MADEAAFSAEFDSVGKAGAELSQAWTAFLEGAEMEIAGAPGFPIKKFTRHSYLARRWVPVLGRKDHAQDPVLISRGWQWLYPVWHEIELTVKQTVKLHDHPAATSLQQTCLVEKYPGEGLGVRLDSQVTALRKH
eukprot:9203022-Pyramimonas_sp.AAC.1